MFRLQKHLYKLQKVMNCAARLVCKTPKREHVTPSLAALHWLPVSCRIDYKIATICFHVISGTAPPYLCDLLELYTPSRSLRSSADSRIFRVPYRRRKTQGQRSFSYIAPVVWNQLPFTVRHSDSLSSFKRNLKTHLFSTAYNG